MPTVRRSGRHDAPPRRVSVVLTKDDCRTMLAALADVAHRERQHAAVLLTWGGAASAEASADKRRFADECEQAAAAIRAAMEENRGDGQDARNEPTGHSDLPPLRRGNHGHCQTPPR